MERCAICDFVIDPDEAHVHVRCHANAVSVLSDEIEKLKQDVEREKRKAAAWRNRAKQYLKQVELLERAPICEPFTGQIFSLSGEDDRYPKYQGSPRLIVPRTEAQLVDDFGTVICGPLPQEEILHINPYQVIFDFYNTLGLIKHRKLTKEMRAAIDVARRRGEYSWDDLRMLLDRHAKVVKATAGNKEFAVPARSLTEFFGQKVAGGTALICSEYADDGAKWRRYKDGNPSKKADSRQRSAFERPVGNLDHLALDPFADE